MNPAHSATRARFFRAAFGRFAEFGGAGTSGRRILDEARVAKPVPCSSFRRSIW